MAASVFRLGRQIAEATAALRAIDAPAPADPYQALDELMAVIEELCPVWPSRPTFTNESNNRL